MIAASGQLVGIATFHLIAALVIALRVRVPADASPAARAQAHTGRQVAALIAGLGVLIAAIGAVV